ncbi:hypothetical protein D3C78_1873010 [compost metagenome]
MLSTASPVLTIGTPSMIAELSCWNCLSLVGRARSLTLIRVPSGTICPLSLFT